MKNIVVASLLLGAFGLDAVAAPVDAVSLTTTTVGVRSTSENERSNLSLPGAPGSFDNISFAGASAGQGVALSDLAAGQLKASATITNLGGPDTFADVFGFAEWNEFVTFSASTEIAFSLAVDGLLGISSADDLASATSFLSIYDVTDQTNVFNTSGSPFRFSPETLSNEVFSSQRAIYLSGSDSILPVNLDCMSTDVTCLSGVGNSGPVFSRISGTLDVVAGRQYLLSTGLFSGAFSNASGATFAASNFFNTAQFEFTNLNGAEFASASGTFLSTAPVAPVPLPASLPFLLVGIGGLCLLKRKRGYRSQ